MLGYCLSCAKLVSLRQGSQRWGTRERQYYPVDHSSPDWHKDCGGTVILGEKMYQCQQCMEFVDDTQVDFGESHCPGVKRSL